MPPFTKPYQDALLQALQHPQDAVAYLMAALEDGDKAVLVRALQNVADAYVKALETLGDAMWALRTQRTEQSGSLGAEQTQHQREELTP